MSDDAGNSNGGGSSTPSPTEVTTSSQPTHIHAIGSESRAVVVGKSLTKASAANQVIDVLVDIAGYPATGASRG